MRHFTVTSFLAFMVVGFISISASAQMPDAVKKDIAGRGAAIFFDADAEKGAGSGEIDIEATLIGNILYVTGKVQKLSSPVVENNSSKNGLHLFIGEPGKAHTKVFPLELQMTDNATRGAIGGRIELTDAEVKQLREGKLGIDIHTEQHPKGEVSGRVEKD